MRRGLALFCVFAMTLALGLGIAKSATATGADRPPNFVIIYADDLGYGDLGCQGGSNPTPNLDRMAAEGRRLTDFYVAQAVCSASRTALLTGCYPNRVGIRGALGPNSAVGIHANERTLAEALKPYGYATAIFGKWHLGDSPKFLPVRHGFDRYFGLPYSNDMWPKHPSASAKYPELPLIDGDKVAKIDPDQTQLTTWSAERAVEFIRAHAKTSPFFLYVPHSMPHVPLHVSERFRGKTGKGIYADVIAEIDWSVGEILKELKTQGVDERTLVIFASDNGPWLSYGDHAGSAGPLREGKGTTFEGGVRVPFLARWPGMIPAGTICKEPAMTIDLLPTLVKLAGGTVPSDRKIDGLDISPLLLGASDAKSPHDALYFYWDSGLEAVRSGSWKLHFPHEYRSLKGKGGSGGKPAPYANPRIGLALYDLANDIGESRDAAGDHPDVVRRLTEYAERARADLGDSLTGRQGSGNRPPGRRDDRPNAGAAQKTKSDR